MATDLLLLLIFLPPHTASPGQGEVPLVLLMLYPSVSQPHCVSQEHENNLKNITASWIQTRDF